MNWGMEDLLFIGGGVLCFMIYMKIEEDVCYQEFGSMNCLRLDNIIDIYIL